jgi:hypothetical protein
MQLAEMVIEVNWKGLSKKMKSRPVVTVHPADNETPYAQHAVTMETWDMESDQQTGRIVYNVHDTNNFGVWKTIEVSYPMEGLGTESDVLGDICLRLTNKFNKELLVGRAITYTKDDDQHYIVFELNVDTSLSDESLTTQLDAFCSQMYECIGELSQMASIVDLIHKSIETMVESAVSTKH